MPKYLSNTTFFSDNLGTYIANGEIETNKLTTNGDIILTGSITNGSNSITFTENTLYTNIPQNFFINGTGLIKYQGVNYNIGQVLAAFVGGGTISPYPSITYDSSLNTTTFTGLLLFPATSISSASINNSDFATISTSQTLSNKTFSGTTIFSSIQLNDNLITSNGGTTILNSNLALVNFLSGTSSNINSRFTTNETNISTLLTRTTNVSFSSPITTISSTLASSIFTISTSINGTTKAVFDNILLYCNSLSGNVQTAITTANTNITTNSNNITTNTNNITTNTNSINTINTNLANYALQSALQAVLDEKIGTMIYFQNTDFNICKNIASLGEIQYTDANNNKINIVPIILSSQDKLLNVTRNQQFNFFDINSNVHIYEKLQLGAYNDVEYSLNAVIIAQGITAGFTATNTTAIAFIVATTLPAMQIEIDGLGITVGDHSTDIGGLQQKTSQISYNSATDRTTISQTLYSPYLEVGNIESGFNQTTNDQVTFTGEVRCNNRVEINNTLELINNNNIIVEGIINQDNANPPNAGVNQFQAPTNLNGNVIITNTSTSINSATTQIGTNAISTLNCNSSAIFGGDITMSIDKNLTLKNIVPILLDDIYFGGQAGVYINDDVVFNMKIEANRPLQINNTCQIGTTISRNSLTSYTTTTLLDSNTSITLNSPIINITAPYVGIGQSLGFNYLFGTTFVQNLYSSSGIVGMAGQVFQQF